MNWIDRHLKLGLLLVALVSLYYELTWLVWPRVLFRC